MERSHARRRSQVLIAGGGVAGLEAAAALAALAPDRADITVLSPRGHFSYEPLTVREPLDGAPAPAYDTAAILERIGAAFEAGVVKRVDGHAHRVLTRENRVLHYDKLVLALGAAPVPALPGAITFAGSRDVERLAAELRRLERAGGGSVAFVVPRGAGWVLPLYELALLTREWAGERGVELDLTVITREGHPLGVFGGPVAEDVELLLAERGIALRTASFADEVEDGEVFLELEGPLEADLVVSLPALMGPAVSGVPHDGDGFVPVDAFGRVPGLRDVYAVGDMTTRPLKQGGLAAQQADVAAEHIAAALGADVAPRPYVPSLEGLLMTGRHDLSLHRSGREAPSRWTEAGHPVETSKIAARHLAPLLAAERASQTRERTPARA